jgi:transcriptional regulator NrdR family protein
MSNEQIEQTLEDSSAHGMPCPVCGGGTNVWDSRIRDKDGVVIRRRRRCVQDHRFTTIERVESAAVALDHEILSRAKTHIERGIALLSEIVDRQEC